MIDAKSFMEFFEKEYGVHFVDAQTGEILDIKAEYVRRKNNPYNDPAYKSDYDKFLEAEDGGEMSSNSEIIIFPHCRRKKPQLLQILQQLQPTTATSLGFYAEGRLSLRAFINFSFCSLGQFNFWT